MEEQGNQQAVKFISSGPLLAKIWRRCWGVLVIFFLKHPQLWSRGMKKGWIPLPKDDRYTEKGAAPDSKE